MRTLILAGASHFAGARSKPFHALLHFTAKLYLAMFAMFFHTDFSNITNTKLLKALAACQP